MSPISQSTNIIPGNIYYINDLSNHITALYSTKWVQTVFRRQNNQSGLIPVEQSIMDDIRQFTSISQEENGERLSFAAMLAIALATHFDDVWVWQGVSKSSSVHRSEVQNS